MSRVPGGRPQSGNSQSRVTHKCWNTAVEQLVLRRTYETSRPGQFAILTESGWGSLYVLYFETRSGRSQTHRHLRHVSDICDIRALRDPELFGDFPAPLAITARAVATAAAATTAEATGAHRRPNHRSSSWREPRKDGHFFQSATYGLLSCLTGRVQPPQAGSAAQTREGIHPPRIDRSMRNLTR